MANPQTKKAALFRIKPNPLLGGLQEIMFKLPIVGDVYEGNVWKPLIGMLFFGGAATYWKATASDAEAYHYLLAARTPPLPGSHQDGNHHDARSQRH